MGLWSSLWIVVVCLLGLATGYVYIDETVISVVSMEDWVPIDGNRLVELRPRNDTMRLLVHLNGYDADDGNTPCGREAWARLGKLMKEEGLRLDEVPKFDEQGVAYVYGSTHSGDSVASLMVSEGFAQAIDEDLMAVQEETKKNGNGCTWVEFAHEEIETTGEEDKLNYEASGDFSRMSLEKVATMKLEKTPAWPKGFTSEKVVSFFSRPVDFLFVPGTDSREIIVAENKGKVKLIRDNKVVPQLVMDITSIINRYQDHGILSIAVPPDFEKTKRFFVFCVYEHLPGIEISTGPKSSTVLRTNLKDGVEIPAKRKFILGTKRGPGCDSFGPDADCIPAEGKSHVGGALTFASNGDLYVSVGDGATATVNEEAKRAQSIKGYSGTILRVDQEGRGRWFNPFAVKDLNARRSKIWAYGVRNPLHCHTSPDNSDRIYCGDTMWSEMEEVHVIARKDNCGWPCYEGTIKRQQYAQDDICLKLKPEDVALPLVTWEHTPDGNHASIAGPKLRMSGWPEFYNNTIVYGDIAAKWIGFARVTTQDKLIADIHRVSIPEAVVQLREGPDSTLYYLNVRGEMGLHKVSYKPINRKLIIENSNPEKDSTSRRNPRQHIYMSFNKPLDPRTVQDGFRLVNTRTNGDIPITVVNAFYSQTISLRPLVSYEPGVKYRIVLTNKLKDLDGNSARGLDWEFTVGENSSATPRVRFTVPADRATDVNPEAWISIFFNVDMDVDSLQKVVIRMAREYNKPIGPVIPFTYYNYHRATGRFRFQAPLNRGQMYTVRVPKRIRGVYASGILSEEGVPLAFGRRFTFTTLNSTSTRLKLTVTKPVMGMTTIVGDVIDYDGSATFDGEPVPASAFSWTMLTYHCRYNSSACHDHATFTAEGKLSGSFRAIDHEDKFFYTVELRVLYNGHRQQLSIPVMPRVVEFTLDSSPPGSILGINGMRTPSPFTVNIAIGSTAQIIAPSQFGSAVFDSWSCGGGRVQEITAPSRNFNCTAIYL